MKKEFETPTIEIIYYDVDIKLGDSVTGGDWEDDNVDGGGWT